MPYNMNIQQRYIVPVNSYSKSDFLQTVNDHFGDSSFVNGTRDASWIVSGDEWIRGHTQQTSGGVWNTFRNNTPVKNFNEAPTIVTTDVAIYNPKKGDDSKLDDSIVVAGFYVSDLEAATFSSDVRSVSSKYIEGRPFPGYSSDANALSTKHLLIGSLSAGLAVAVEKALAGNFESIAILLPLAVSPLLIHAIRLRNEAMSYESLHNPNALFFGCDAIDKLKARYEHVQSVAILDEVYGVLGREGIPSEEVLIHWNGLNSGLRTEAVYQLRHGTLKNEDGVFSSLLNIIREYQ